ncbi:hypothetical protein KJ909_04020, partial [Patescibacteria group bacterium]|nr:hypothetical protein [Patescibacteria group bacterium]
MGDDSGILTSHQIAAMVGVGSSQAGFQPLPLSPTLMRAIGSNPYTPQGGMAAQQLGAAALNALVSPQTPFLGSLTQGAMNRAQFMGNLGMVSHPGGGGPMGMGFGMAER